MCRSVLLLVGCALSRTGMVLRQCGTSLCPHRDVHTPCITRSAARASQLTEHLQRRFAKCCWHPEAARRYRRESRIEVLGRKRPQGGTIRTAKRTTRDQRSWRFRLLSANSGATKAQQSLVQPATSRVGCRLASIAEIQRLPEPSGLPAIWVSDSPSVRRWSRPKPVVEWSEV
jgi:hypothetical protein